MLLGVDMFQDTDSNVLLLQRLIEKFMTGTDIGASIYALIDSKMFPPREPNLEKIDILCLKRMLKSNWFGLINKATGSDIGRVLTT